MSAVADYLLAGGVSILVGLDRTAAMQFMISRPIVAAPLTGLLLGDFWLGLRAGMLLEFLWLGRLPVGAAIPPDDTQIAVGGTALAVVMGAWSGGDSPMLFLCLLVALPLGKAGQLFDRWARLGNGWLLRRAETALANHRSSTIERWHLAGLGLFALASLSTYLVIVSLGSLIVPWLAPRLMNLLAEAAPWLGLAFPLVGTAMILGPLRNRRVAVLVGASFVVVYFFLGL